MKKAGRILSLVIILVMLTASFCFAAPAEDVQDTESQGTLVLKDTYPKDGSKGASIENMSVKLYFDSEFTEEVLKDKNENAIQFIGPDGKKLPTRVLYSEKEKDVVLVVVDNDKDGKTITGEGNSEYTLKVSGALTDDAGRTLGQDMTITFTTLNQKANTLVNMAMMFVMFGAMMVISMKSAKKAAEEQQKAKKEEAHETLKSSISREDALALLKKYNSESFHIQHALTCFGIVDAVPDGCQDAEVGESVIDSLLGGR